MKPHRVVFCLFASTIILGSTAPLFGAEPPSLAELAKTKRDLAKMYLEYLDQEVRDKPPMRSFGEIFEDVSKWSKRLADAKLELAATHDERLRALDEHTTRLAEHVKLAGDLEEGGEMPRRFVLSLQYDLAEAQTALRKLKDQKK